MPRFILLCGLLFLAGAAPAPAFDDGPPISITSPDQATTYALASLKNHSLVWNKKSRQLVAHLVFEELDPGVNSGGDDAHEFRLPGVTFDPAKGVFSATSAKGEVIPVARLKKTLFFTTVETLPNAVVRILRTRGNVTVILEAIRPDDPALHAPAAPASDPENTHSVDIQQILH